MNKDRKLIWTSVFASIGASLCCIAPVATFILGASGIAATFSWLEPLRPYLIGITILVLVFAWYQKLKPEKVIVCECENNTKPKFIQSKLFLGIVTGFAIVMLAFPYYGNIFYPNTEMEKVVFDKANIQKVNIAITGMTCTSCEEHVNYSVGKLHGILSVGSSYENKNSEIEFDKTKLTIADIKNAIDSTGYKVTEINYQ